MIVGGRMRTIYPSRNLGTTKSNDIQYMIDEKPSTAVVTRRVGGTRTDATDSTIATFQARLDTWRNSPRDTQQSDAAIGQNVMFLLTTRFTLDSSGRTVAFEVNDKITIDSEAYSVISKISETGVKHEGVLILVQP